MTDALNAYIDAHVERDRERIWQAITSWELPAYANDGTIVEGFTHRPLRPFFEELRAMVFDEGRDAASAEDGRPAHGQEGEAR